MLSNAGWAAAMNAYENPSTDLAGEWERCYFWFVKSAFCYHLYLTVEWLTFSIINEKSEKKKETANGLKVS